MPLGRGRGDPPSASRDLHGEVGPRTPGFPAPEKVCPQARHGRTTRWGVGSATSRQGAAEMHSRPLGPRTLGVSGITAPLMRPSRGALTGGGGQSQRLWGRDKGSPPSSDAKELPETTSPPRPTTHTSPGRVADWTETPKEPPLEVEAPWERQAPIPGSLCS